MVKLIVSGQLTLGGPSQRAEVAVGVLVSDWPSLDDVIENVTFASTSQPIYVNESVKFVYAVEKVVPNVSYWVRFDNNQKATVRKIHVLPILHFSRYLDNIVMQYIETIAQQECE